MTPAKTLPSDWFYPILIVSVISHLVLILYVNAARLKSDFSVENAPNTISISILKSMPEKRKIVEQRVIEPPAEEVTEQLVETPPLEEIKVIETTEKSINEIVEPAPVIEEFIKVQEEVVQDVPIEEPTIEQEEVIEETLLVEESAGAITEAKPLSYVNPAPKYPGTARRRGWEGIVLLEVSVNSHGAVDNVNIKESSGYSSLDRAALETVEEWKFEPAQKGSDYVSSMVIVPIEFKLVE